MAIYQDEVLVKRAYKKVNYTPQQVDELRACFHPQTGPLYFIKNFMYIQHPLRGREKIELYDFQLDLIDLYHNYRKSIAMVSRQMGKALSLDTPILTPFGFKTMGDIVVGDTIYGKNGKSTTVTHITDVMNDRPCYEIEFMHGEKIIADKEHLWEVNDPSGGKKIYNTGQLVERFDKLKSTTQSMHIEHCAAIQFEEKPLQIHPYLLGLWLGDGESVGSRITCTVEDFHIYEIRLKGLGYNISEFRFNKGSTTVGSFTVYELAAKLKKLNLRKNKHIPGDYILNSEENRLELLRGLMDTDGTCEKNGTSKFYQSNQAFAEQVRFLLSTLGIKSTLGVRKTYRKDSYTVTFSTNKFDVFSLPRKYERQKFIKNHPKNSRIYIRNIRKIDSVPVRCLQVDNEDHLFLCGKTLVPTHNSTIAAAYLLWYAMFNNDVTVLVSSNKSDGAQEIMHRVRYAYESIPDHIRAGVTVYNKRSMNFDNNSRILATTTTENTGRGLSISLIYLDELAAVPPGIAKEFWASLSPTLSTGGKCIITSTPNTDEDQFAEIWYGAEKRVDAFGNESPIGKNGFRSYKAIWDAHPERDQAWADAEFEALKEDRFLREHCCEFITFEETLVNGVKLSKLESSPPINKTGLVRWYAPIDKDMIYIVSLDPSMGTGGDNAAIQVVEMPSLVQVAEWSSNRAPIEEQIRTLRRILQEIQEAGAPETYWSVESNTLGEAALVVIRDTGEESFYGTMLHDPKNRLQGKTGRRSGFVTTNKSKLEACAKLKYLVESGKLKLHSRGIISELKTFVSRSNTYEARIGQTDDLIMAMILNIRMMDFISTWDEKSLAAINSALPSDDDSSFDAPMPIFI